MFGGNLVGRQLQVNGVGFTVEEIKPYPAADVSKKYVEILKHRPNVVVAVSYRGTLIPNITLEGGVVRLMKISVGRQVYDKPSTISRVLGVTEAMVAYDLK